ncbi:hypothetical protein EB232_35410 (plasmid) [Mesorhizobium sp. NZP2077]|nr:hypothetical protein EB232_35410 [Mesorhizobium sp. NZP2077]QKD20679.1 hypothetical protein HGP13_37355 [Mesorhizobium sp. NZP2077]
MGVISSAYLILCGAILLTDWTNPFEGKGGALGSAVHNAKGWLIVGAIVVWPYLLTLVGLVIGLIAVRELRGGDTAIKLSLDQTPFAWA